MDVRVCVRCEAEKGRGKILPCWSRSWRGDGEGVWDGGALGWPRRRERWWQKLGVLVFRIFSLERLMMKLLKTLAHSFLSLFLSECFVYLMMFFDSEMLAFSSLGLWFWCWWPLWFWCWWFWCCFCFSVFSSELLLLAFFNDDYSEIACFWDAFTIFLSLDFDSQW